MDNNLYINIKKEVSITIQNDGAILKQKDIPDVKLTGKYLLFLYLICQNQNIYEQIENISKIFQCNKEKAHMQLYEFLGLFKNCFTLSSEKGKNKPLSITEVQETLKNKKISKPSERAMTPHIISYSITDTCYMNCIYCYANAKKTNTKVKAYVPIDRFKSLVDEAVAIGVSKFELTGGDPFCVENIIEYLEILEKSKIDWTTSTKAYISHSQANQLAKIGVTKIQVSLDSYNVDTVNYLTNRKDGYAIIIKTIKNLQEHHIDVRVKAIISSVNIREIPAFIKYLEKNSIKEVAFSWYGALCGRSDLNLYPSQEDILWLNNQMTQLKSKTKIHIDYEEHSLGFIDFLESPLSYKHFFRKKCGASKFRLAINANGDVCFCEYLGSEQALTIGNITKNSIMELWNSPALMNLLYPDKENFKHTDCYTCSLFENCYERRCFLRSKRCYGTVFDKDPWCKYGDASFCEY